MKLTHRKNAFLNDCTDRLITVLGGPSREDFDEAHGSMRTHSKKSISVIALRQDVNLQTTFKVDDFAQVETPLKVLPDNSEHEKIIATLLKGKAVEFYKMSPMDHANDLQLGGMSDTDVDALCVDDKTLFRLMLKNNF